MQHVFLSIFCLHLYHIQRIWLASLQESWELHDAVEVGGGDLEERGDVGAFDQVRVGIVGMDRKIYIYIHTLYWVMNIWIVGIGKTV